MKDILTELFENSIKVRIIKLFIRNPQKSFSFNDLTKKIKLRRGEKMLSQIKKLEKIGFIRKIKEGKSDWVWQLNPEFVFLEELNNLVVKSVPVSNEVLVSKFKKVKGIKMVVISGVFLNTDNKRVDLFLVGNGVDQKILKRLIRELEAEVGKEIDYVLLSSDDFIYRRKMFDRFIEDIFEKPHQKIIDKIKE